MKWLLYTNILAIIKDSLLIFIVSELRLLLMALKKSSNCEDWFQSQFSLLFIILLSLKRLHGILAKSI